MILFSEYQSLGQSHKAEILFSEGISLDLVRHTPRLKIELYSLADFYVEIFYDKFTDDPLFLQSFEHLEGLEPYLDMVSIEGLLTIEK